ncbi:MAG TPA: ATP synthase F1 subunit epsilon [Candidatus Saccharimonadia bacterium]|nr:ATP synthase F1 subunit epsilon [Candidatus Saccharimonadia bacterium]
MKFELLTLSGAKFQGEAEEVQLTTTSGQMGVLPHHEPLVAQVVPGAVTVRTGKGAPEVFATYGGLLEVTADHVRLLADEADHESELVAEEIEAALAEAKEMRDKAKDKTELANAQQMIDRSQVRLGVARMRRTHHRERPPQG